MKFTTVTGSVYEIDEQRKRIRRLSGEHDPTPYQGGTNSDGEWKNYLETTSITVGRSVVILWNAEGNSTVTSTVKTVGDPPKFHYCDIVKVVSPETSSVLGTVGSVLDGDTSSPYALDTRQVRYVLVLLRGTREPMKLMEHQLEMVLKCPPN